MTSLHDLLSAVADRLAAILPGDEVLLDAEGRTVALVADEAMTLRRIAIRVAALPLRDAALRAWQLRDTADILDECDPTRECKAAKGG